MDIGLQALQNAINKNTLARVNPARAAGALIPIIYASAVSDAEYNSQRSAMACKKA